jgi:hypothetical protein
MLISLLHAGVYYALNVPYQFNSNKKGAVVAHVEPVGAHVGAVVALW